MRSHLRKIPPLLDGALDANSYGGGSTYIDVCVGQTQEGDSVIGTSQCHNVTVGAGGIGSMRREYGT